MATIAGMLATSARRCPDRVALIFGERRYTYGELDRAVNRAAHALAAAGLGKGDRIALMSGNSDGFGIACYAALRLGALVVPVDPASVAPEVRYVLADSEASLLVFGAGAEEVVGKLGEQPSLIGGPIALGPVGAFPATPPERP
ncbi:AMP-binding protein [Saccharopolyspora sp. NPDC050389]|uniref:AMP-binding protein n=1 Tax=Saccharopolyspora sp. NPDC050389 TaxID=3155516 RepID=UPI0034085355